MRGRWSSRSVFLLAAIASAVGLGNIWRFPYITYQYGGGAFLIPYLIALFVIGIPLLMLEFAIGEKLQKGPIGAFEKIDKRIAGLGLLAIITTTLITSYYTVIIAWTLIYFVKSFATVLPWSGDPESFFFNDVLHISDSIETMGGINWQIFLALIVVWIIIYFCVWKGVKSLGSAVKWMLPIPLILLAVLLVRAMTLPGFFEGWIFYLKPDWSMMLNVDLWVNAVAQVFFSLSLGFGIMIAYASFRKKDSDIARDSVVTAIADSAIAVFAGFVVFGILGYMAQVQNVGVADVVASGPGLAFVAFPQALSLMPFPWLFSAAFFLMLLNFGITSAFSLIETINTIFIDRKKISEKVTSFWVSIGIFLLAVVFTTSAGLYYLDVVDHYITNYSLLIIGILEVLAVGWIFGAEKLRTYIDKVSDFKINKLWTYAIKYIIPIALFVILVFNFLHNLQEPYGGYPRWVLNLGWLVVVLPLVAAGMFSWRTSKVKTTKN